MGSGSIDLSATKTTPYITNTLYMTSSYDFSKSEYVQSPSGSNTQIRDLNLTKFKSLVATWGRDSGSTHFVHFDEIGVDGNYNTAVGGNALRVNTTGGLNEQRRM